jgi:hypothetical protein
VRVGSLSALGRRQDAHGLKAWHADESPDREGVLAELTRPWCEAP